MEDIKVMVMASHVCMYISLITKFWKLEKKLRKESSFYLQKASFFCSFKEHLFWGTSAKAGSVLSSHKLVSLKKNPHLP